MMNKRILSVLCLLPACLWAHPGALDKNGGHQDSKTGEYHNHIDKSKHVKKTPWVMLGDAEKVTEPKPTYRETHYQAIAAKVLKGKTEVNLGDGRRCDIVTDEYAIEVDWKSKWSEAVGQSLDYGFLADKKCGIVLIVDSREDTKEALRINSICRHYELPIKIWLIAVDTEKVYSYN